MSPLKYHGDGDLNDEYRQELGGVMKLFTAAIEVKMTHDGRYYLMVDSENRSSGTSAEDLKELAEKVGKLIVEHLMEGK